MLSSAKQAGESGGEALPETAVRVGHGRFCTECAQVPGRFSVPTGSRGGAPPRRSTALAREAGAPGGMGSLQPPGEEGDRAQVVWQWVAKEGPVLWFVSIFHALG